MGLYSQAQYIYIYIYIYVAVHKLNVYEQGWPFTSAGIRLSRCMQYMYNCNCKYIKLLYYIIL